MSTPPASTRHRIPRSRGLVFMFLGVQLDSNSTIMPKVKFWWLSPGIWFRQLLKAQERFFNQPLIKGSSRSQSQQLSQDSRGVVPSSLLQGRGAAGGKQHSSAASKAWCLLNHKSWKRWSWKQAPAWQADILPCLHDSWRPRTRTGHVEATPTCLYTSLKHRSLVLAQVGLAQHRQICFIQNYSAGRSQASENHEAYLKICFLSQILEVPSVLINVSHTCSLRADIHVPNPSHMLFLSL